MANEIPDSLRLFYALWPDDATRTGLMQLQQSFGGRKVTYGNLHVTLAFLGQQRVALLPLLKEILVRLPKTPLVLTFDKVGYFARNRIAWAGMHEVPDGLLNLQQDLMQALARHGVSCDSKSRFKPHITLARDAPEPLDIVFEPIRWQARQAVLVQSANHPAGPEYRVLASRSLEEEIWMSSASGVD